MVTITQPKLEEREVGESVRDKQGREVKRRTVLVMARWDLSILNARLPACQSVGLLDCPGPYV